MRDPNNPCLFCSVKESGLADENTLAYASYDTYPVSEWHCLIIPKRHVKNYFELTNNEVIACNDLIKIIKENKIYSPSKNIYKGVTYDFFKKKLYKITNKDILVKSLIDYDEILLIGSGKAVTSVETIKEINWKRKGLKYYKIFSNFYKKEILKCAVYR